MPLAKIEVRKVRPASEVAALIESVYMFIHLKSGKTMQGYVKSVGNGLLHLEKLTGKDFYDALIKIEDISAIEAKFREMK